MEIKKDKKIDNFFKKNSLSNVLNSDEIKKTKVSLEKREALVGFEKKTYSNIKSNNKKSVNPKEVVVSVENLRKNFIVGQNNIEVLKGVNVEIRKGDFALLIGPSGCGKSTLLHIIYGIESPTEGKVKVSGDDIWSHNKNWRADFRNSSIGFIPQQAFWLKALTVLENVAIPAIIGGKKFHKGLEKAAEMLDLVGMAGWAHHRPYDLSGGQQQRVALARALLLNPWFIIADEPTGNLDQKAGAELMDLMQDLNERFELTILMVTHNQEHFKYATKLVNVVDGVIV